eukprot:CAMPEP_0202857786 /NCGR_PEP_ID=MMETSP1391-20130828/591_1 /ASSEMBLY_ACC=CAM_ASM_000867 /TAXON_ID=1034604 /ORGANISM="Chlamydomonas leiostraca, Strain SAG 11-49" /LENGTH=117 /DNA_ID=CAMNT_0049536633 /DNA_START=54 /DNA_END=407 /DNA_ORIENTATION=+
MEVDLNEVKQEIKEVKAEIRALAVGHPERAPLQGRLAALQEKEVLLLKQAQAAAAAQPPAEPPDFPGDRMLQMLLDMGKGLWGLLNNDAPSTPTPTPHHMKWASSPSHPSVRRRVKS